MNETFISLLKKYGNARFVLGDFKVVWNPSISMFELYKKKSDRGDYKFIGMCESEAYVCNEIRNLNNMNM